MLSYEEFCKKIQEEKFTIKNSNGKLIQFEFDYFFDIFRDSDNAIFKNVETGKISSICITYLYRKYLLENLLFEDDSKVCEQKLKYGDKFFVVDYEYERIYCEAVTIIGRDVDGNIYYNSLRPEHCYITFEEAMQALKRGE